MNNVVDEYTNFILKQFCFYAKKIMERYYVASLFNELAKEYINIRYYNVYPQKQNHKTTISYYLNQKIKALSNENPLKVKNIIFMVEIFNFLIALDSDLEAVEVNVIEKQLELIRKNYNLNDSLEFSKEFRDFRKTKREYLKSYETEDFYIEYTKTKESNLFNTKLMYNFKMPEIYSKKALNAIFDRGLVKEDKMFVLYNLVGVKVLEEIIDYNYNNKYLIDFDINLKNKQEKFNRLFEIIDNDISREKLIFKISFSQFKDNQKDIFNLINVGYNFALIKDKNYEQTEYEGLFKYVLEVEV